MISTHDEIRKHMMMCERVKMKRGDFCDSAKKIITQDRNNQYGEPQDLFGNIAVLWTEWARMRGILAPHAVISPYDVAQMMVAFKLCRAAFDPSKGDTIEDQIGYSAIAGELSVSMTMGKTGPAGDPEG